MHCVSVNAVRLDILGICKSAVAHYLCLKNTGQMAWQLPAALQRRQVSLFNRDPMIWCVEAALKRLNPVDLNTSHLELNSGSYHYTCTQHFKLSRQQIDYAMHQLLRCWEIQYVGTHVALNIHTVPRLPANPRQSLPPAPWSPHTPKRPLPHSHLPSMTSLPLPKPPTNTRVLNLHQWCCAQRPRLPPVVPPSTQAG